jgi:acyl transferase domain-containing protein
MKIAFHRGLLVGNIKAGLSTPEAMISVNIGQDSVESYLQNILPSLSTKFHVSCVNSPVNCTLSGAEKDVDLLLSHLEADQIFAVKLRTGVAYHSPTMQKIALEYMQAIGYLHPGTQQQESQMVSSVTGDIVPKHILLSPLYWVNNLVSTVQFTDAVTYLLENPPASCAITQLVEIGPHSALRRPIQDIMSNMSPKGRQARYLSVLDRYNCAATSFLSMLGNLFCAGFPVPIQRANQSLGTPSKETIPVLHDCPSYPFNHTRSYWSESRIARDYRLRKAVPSDSLGMRSHDWNPLEPRWRNRLSVERMPWIGDHVVSYFIA